MPVIIACGTWPPSNPNATFDPRKSAFLFPREHRSQRVSPMHLTEGRSPLSIDKRETTMTIKTKLPPSRSWRQPSLQLR